MLCEGESRWEIFLFSSMMPHVVHEEGGGPISICWTNDFILMLSLNIIKRNEKKLKKGDQVECHKCVFNSKFFSVESVFQGQQLMLHV